MRDALKKSGVAKRARRRAVHLILFNIPASREFNFKGWRYSNVVRVAPQIIVLLVGGRAHTAAGYKHVLRE